MLWTILGLVALVPIQGAIFDQLTDFFAQFEFIFKLVRFVVAFVVVYLLGRLIGLPLVKRLIHRNERLTPTVRRPLLKTAHVGVYLLAFFAGLFFARLQALLAVTGGFAAALTLAVGFASRDLVSNLISGLFIITDPKFNIGDWISWVDQNNNTAEGVIEDISFRSTRVRTFRNELVTVPSSVLVNANVTNYDLGDQLRIDYPFGVEYGGDISTMQEAILDEALAHPQILDEPEPTVLVDDVAAAGVNFMARFWIAEPNRQKYLSVRSEYFQAVKERLEREDIEMSPDLLEVMGDLGVDETSIPLETEIER